MTTVTLTAFHQQQQIAHGTLPELIKQVKGRHDLSESVFVFHDLNGKRLELNFNADEATVYASALNLYPELAPPLSAEEQAVKSRGRPRLGVKAKEVTLLPRHWEWLATQPGGASATLRRLIEQARKTSQSADKSRQRHERAYHFMHEVAGDLPEYETSLRALFADDSATFKDCIASWPMDIQRYACQLAFQQEDPE